MHLEALDTFISLVELDAQITRYVREQKKIKENMAAFKEQAAHITSQLSAQESSIHSLKKKIDALDLDLKVADEQLSQKKSRIAHAASPKEFFSLEHEIEALTIHKNNIEERLFILWDELDTKQKEHKNFAESALDQKNKLLKEVLAFEAELQHIDKRITALKDERPQLIAQVPQELFGRYAYMLESISNPVVPILKDACSGCFYSLTAKNLTDARKDQLVTCSECNRLLYALKEIREGS